MLNQRSAGGSPTVAGRAGWRGGLVLVVAQSAPRRGQPGGSGKGGVASRAGRCDAVVAALWVRRGYSALEILSIGQLYKKYLDNTILSAVVLGGRKDGAACSVRRSIGRRPRGADGSARSDPGDPGGVFACAHNPAPTTRDEMAKTRSRAYRFAYGPETSWVRPKAEGICAVSLARNRA